MSQADTKNITPPSRRAILRGAPAAALALTGVMGAAVAAPPDPIFALIEEHRAAHKRDMDGMFPPDEEAVEVFNARCERVEVVSARKFYAWERFIGTKPTTLPGVVAFVAYAAQLSSAERSDGLFSTAIPALETLAAAIRDLVPGGHGAIHV